MMQWSAFLHTCDRQTGMLYCYRFDLIPLLPT